MHTACSNLSASHNWSRFVSISSPKIQYLQATVEGIQLTDHRNMFNLMYTLSHVSTS